MIAEAQRTVEIKNEILKTRNEIVGRLVEQNVKGLLPNW
jgi:hypothetical protein